MADGQSRHLCKEWRWTGEMEGKLQLMRCWGCGRVRALGSYDPSACQTQRELDLWGDGHWWGERDGESEASFDAERLSEELEEVTAYGRHLEEWIGIKRDDGSYDTEHPALVAWRNRQRLV
jgi:hypothetical protein